MRKFYTQLFLIITVLGSAFVAQAQSYDSLANCYSTTFGSLSPVPNATSFVAEAADGNIWVAGETRNASLPVTANAVEKTIGANTRSPFLAKFTPEGQLLYLSYWGGNRVIDNITWLAASDGSLYMAGTINSSIKGTFQTVNAYQSNPISTAGNLVITKFNTSGQIVYSTYYGLGGTDIFGAPSIRLAEGSNGALFIASSSANWPVVNAYQPASAGGSDFAVAKLDASGQPIYSTFFGGTSGDSPGASIAVGPGDVLYVAGRTSSTNFPKINSPFPAVNYVTFGGAVLVKFNQAGQVEFSGYLSGGNACASNGQVIVRTDNTGNCYVVDGSNVTLATFPVVNAPHTKTNGPSIQKFTPSGNVVYSFKWGADALCGGGGVTDMVVDSDGSVVIYGMTGSSAFPVVNAAKPSKGTPTLISTYLAKFNPNGQPVFSTFWDGNDDTRTDFIANRVLRLTPNGDIWIAGRTSASNFKLTANALVKTPHHFSINHYKAFISRFTKNGQNTYSSYWGVGNNEEMCIAVGQGGKLFYTGNISNSNWPVDPNAYPTTPTALIPAPISNKHQVFTIFSPLAVWEDSIENIIEPDTQRFCLGGPIQPFTGNRVLPAGIFRPKYQWQVSLISPLDPAFDPQADWINLPGAILQDFTPPTAPEDRWYRRLVLNTAPEECDDDNPLSPAQLLSESNIVFVEGSITPAPLVDAGPVIFVCPGVPVQIGGSPTVTGGTPPYTINWDFGQLLNDSTIANPIATSNQNTIFTVEVRDANECYNLAQMTLRVVSADAGADTLTYCSGQSVRIGTPSVAGSNASFNWAPSSGLSCTDCPRPIASPLTNTWYYLTKTVYLPGGDSCQTFDSVFVAVGDAPTNVVDDVVWCYSVPNTFEIGYPAESGFNYTWAPGTYLVSNDSSAVFFNSGNIFLTPDGLGGNPVRPNPFPYILTATNGTCVWYDTMTVTMIRADAGIDGCGPRTIGVNWHPQIPATYQWTLVSGPDNIVGPRNQVITTVLGSDTETSVYELEVCYNGVCCTDQVVVPPCGCNASISYSSPNNCPTSADPINNPVILTASGSFTTIPNYDPAKVQYSWSPCNFLDTCFGSVVRVQDTATRTYTVTVGYEGFPPSAYCAASITISSPSVSLPVYNVGTYNVCELGDSVQIGQPAVGGYSYQWVGPGGFGSVLADPVVSPPFTPAKYYVTVTDIGTGCTIADTALIEGGVIANAGPDKTVCPGAVVRLGVPDSSGGAWQYIWQPANAPWQNGTDSSFAQPEVLVASNLTFYLTVIDTLIGCSSRDTIEITVDANGPGVTVSDAIICAGQSALVGPEPEFNWVYSWSPSTGLSCTNCAQPTANPVSTTTYTVTIIPSGACVVYNENVTVTVSAPPPFALDSVITCPNINAPLNPGLNGQCSGCTYKWSNNWALINPTSVNPTVQGWATGSIPSFTLTVTDSNGCTRQGSLGLRRIPNEQLGTLDTITKCIAETVALNPAEVGACVGCTYSWSPSSRVSNSTIINPSTNINANTTTFFQLTITKPDGCRSVLNRVVAVIPPPVDTLSELSKCPTTPQGNIQLNPAEFGACVGCTYTWSPATGLSATNVINPTVSNIFSATMYTLTVSSPDGCNRIVRRRVTVIPTQNLGSLPDRVRCPTGPSVAINPGLAGECVGCTYSWFPTNNLSSSTIINPTTNTTVDRVYTLTVTQADGCVNSRTVAVSLALPPFSGDPQEICLGESATLGSPFNNPASSYVWSPSAGLSAANVMQPVFTPTTAGVFNFTLFESRLVNGSNCNLNAPVTVVVNSVAAPVIQNSYSICEGTCVEIGLNEADPQVSYFWFPEDFLTCTDCIKPTACPPQSLLYGLSVVDNSTGCFTTVPVNVNVLNVPIPEINVPAPLSTCQGSGDQLLLNVSIDPAIGNYEFNWSPAIGLSNPFTLQPTLNTNVLPAGVYEYVLEVTDLSTGCGNIKDTVTVTVGEVPEAVCPSSFSIFNTADPLPLQGGLPLGGVYSGNGVTVNGGLYYFNPSIAGLGLHSLSYTYTSPNNCNGNCLIQALVLDESLLPVELLSFEANVVGKKVFLDWETASEFNNDRFEVERSTDIITWEHLGSVTGAGTTSIKTSYQFVDNSPLIGVSYYRLKQVDFDGSEEYSPIKQVEFKEDLSVQKVNWHPNPSKGELIIIPNEEINWVVLTDMSGRAVMTLNYNTVSQRSISLGDLPSGIYLISFISDRVLQTDKLVIQK